MSQLHIVKQKGKRKVLKPITHEQIRKAVIEGQDGTLIDSQHTLISMMLPTAVKAFFEDLESEITALCGDRYKHTEHTATRWTPQAGSIMLANQKVALKHGRVRDTTTGQEIPLETYKRFQNPAMFDQSVFQDGIRHVSQRDYEAGVQQIAASFGVKKSSVSRRWIKSTKKEVEKLLTRELGQLGIIAVFIDGKRFAHLGAVIALGVGKDGKKHVLGIYQSSTENSSACIALLEELERRGLPERDLLFIVDGGSGLNKALEVKYEVNDPEKRRAVRLRCFFHKSKNIEDVLDENVAKEVMPLYWAIPAAKDMVDAKACSDALETCLSKHNKSALASYQEAKDDLLTLHRLGVSSHLRKLFSTTNPIESLNSLLEEDLRRVKRWHNSDQFQRWLATACLRNEKRMHRVKGHSGLPALWVRLQQLCNREERAETAAEPLGFVEATA
ncbi:transposase [Bdellovibrionota bacterium FG-2]